MHRPKPVSYTHLIKIVGVPIGTKWQNIWFVLFKNPNKIKVNQRGKAKLRENTKCLDLVKIYGNNPRKLLSRMKINKEQNNNDLPKDPKLINKFNSKLIVFKTLLIKII